MLSSSFELTLCARWCDVILTSMQSEAPHPGERARTALVAHQPHCIRLLALAKFNIYIENENNPNRLSMQGLPKISISSRSSRRPATPRPLRIMKLDDFHVGLEFLGPSGALFRCTDVGTRVVAAIELDHEESAWYQGPPYIVPELVFDEWDIAHCHRDLTDLVNDRLARATTSAHPNFSGDDFFRMVEEANANGVPYPNQRVLRFDRVRGDGEILHPYSGTQSADGKWLVRIFLLFPRTYTEMPELEFIALPVATEHDMKIRSSRQPMQR
ncbi:conserved hypothetical protein [Ricinus communis]|uniref:Uncharacterized protein n=1 Tax=Ricinus communis TaxID=3988 RepID=B9TGG5_RICCO|nr:conserved hypothetical protein [Ricinus communis]